MLTDCWGYRLLAYVWARTCCDVPVSVRYCTAIRTAKNNFSELIVIFSAAKAWICQLKECIIVPKEKENSAINILGISSEANWHQCSNYTCRSDLTILPTNLFFSYTLHFPLTMNFWCESVILACKTNRNKSKMEMYKVIIRALWCRYINRFLNILHAKLLFSIY